MIEAAGQKCPPVRPTGVSQSLMMEPEAPKRKNGG